MSFLGVRFLKSVVPSLCNLFFLVFCVFLSFLAFILKPTCSYHMRQGRGPGNKFQSELLKYLLLFENLMIFLDLMITN